jgi:hypothetical protein
VREKDVKAVLTREGSDENFLGYDWVVIAESADTCRRAVNVIRRLIRNLPGLCSMTLPPEGPNCGQALALFPVFEREIDVEWMRTHVESVLQCGTAVPESLVAVGVSWRGQRRSSITPR